MSPDSSSWKLPNGGLRPAGHGGDTALHRAARTALTDRHAGALGVSKHRAAVRPWRLIAANKNEMCSRTASAQVEILSGKWRSGLSRRGRRERLFKTQTRSDSNPATTKPPKSIDQSPVSNPRSRPSPVSRKVVAYRNIEQPYDLLAASSNATAIVIGFSTSNGFCLSRMRNSQAQIAQGHDR